MGGAEDMDIDEIMDVPDTPDRLARRAISRESMGRDSDSSIARNFSGRNSLNGSHLNGLRGNDKLVTQNGHFRRPPIIRPSKSFGNPKTSNFGSPIVISPSENSLASESSRMFRKVSMDESSSHRSKHTNGVRNIDKGKSLRVEKSLNHQEGSNYCDLTKPDGCVGNPKTVYNGVSVTKDKKKGMMALSGNSSGSLINESWEMFRNAYMNKEKIDENASNGSGLATSRGITINLSPDSEHKAGERSHQVVSSPRVTGRKCLVRNGCISPQNIAKAELLKSTSRNVEKSHTASGESDFTQPSRDLISELVAEENDNRRLKGKSVFTIPDTSKEREDKFLLGTSSSSFAPDSREANGITNARRDVVDRQGLDGWRRTHSHSGKPVITIPDATGRYSPRIGVSKSVSLQQHETAEAETAVRAATNVSEMGRSSGWLRSEKTITKRLKKQGPTSKSVGECSTSAFVDQDFVSHGLSRESTEPRSSRARDSQSWDEFRLVFEINESPPVGHSTRQSLGSTNDEDSDARARQVEADEILARELQEQLYHEMPIVGGDEFDEHLGWARDQSNTYGGSQNASDARERVIADLGRQSRSRASRSHRSDEIDEQLAWALQHDDDDISDPLGASSSSSHARASMIPDLLRQRRSRHTQNRSNRTPSQQNRRGTLARVASSSRMAQVRGHTNRQRRAVSHRARHFEFPLDMDLDMRLDVLETLEAAFDNFRDADMDNPIYQLQRDFNENDYEMLLQLDDHNHRHGGASSNQINNLPQSVVQTDNQEACAICLESPTVGETVRHLPCLHKFHKDCIDTWLRRKTSCPVCKCSIT